MITIGAKLLSSILASEKPADTFIRMQLKDEFFTGEEVKLFKFIQDYIAEYGGIPSTEAIKTETKVELPEAKDQPDYYLSKVEGRYKHTTVKAALLEANNALKGEDPNKAIETLSNVVMKLTMDNYRVSLQDFRNSASVIATEYARVQNPDSSGVYSGWPSLDDKMGKLSGGDILVIAGRPGQGKAQPITTPTLLSNGAWKPIGELSIGDELASVDGAPSVVTGMYPQGQKEVFELSFRDGRAVECCKEHLWEVRYRGWDSTRILSTEQIIKLLTKKRYQNRLSVRLISGNFGINEEKIITPWLLGFLLGDGCLTIRVGFSTADDYILDKITSYLPDGYGITHNSKYDYSITKGTNSVTPNILKDELARLGLLGHKSTSKFIPEEYFLLDRQSRLELLQGIVDSDGYVGMDGTIEVGVSSPTFANDIRRLVWSLGGMATLGIKKTTHEDCYRIRIMLTNPSECVTLPRKVDRTSSYLKKNEWMTILGVEETSVQECVCISVSHETNLYVTNDYVVTHNTYLSLNMARDMWYTQHKRVLLVSMEMMVLPIFQRLASMQQHISQAKLRLGKLDVDTYNGMLDGLVQLEDHPTPLWVVDGNLTASVKDIALLTRQLEPDVVIVDGAYMLQPSRVGLSDWMQVKDTVEGLKRRIATNMNIPVITSYQFNRASVKKTKGSKSNSEAKENTGLEHLAGADAIGQIASVVLGLFQDDAQEEGEAYVEEKHVKVLKGRNGETGGFDINWRFKDPRPMDFSEIQTTGRMKIT